VSLRVGISWFIAAARGEGESSKHHKSDSPEFHCFHIHFILFVIFAAKLRKREEKVCGETEKVSAEVKV
jgi:hypothetical protein